MASSVVRFSEVLPCQLTRDEKAQAADSLANAISERDALEDQRKAAVDQFKAKISGKEADISKFAGLVRTGVEYRNVTCERRRDYNLGEVIVRRVDTGAVVTRRPMTEPERQAEFDDMAKDGVINVDDGEPVDNGAQDDKNAQDVPQPVVLFPADEKPGYDEWAGQNCDSCQSGGRCAMASEIEEAFFADEPVIPETAQACGYNDREGGVVWACPAKVEATEPETEPDPAKKPSNGKSKAKAAK